MQIPSQAWFQDRLAQLRGGLVPGSGVTVQEAAAGEAFQAWAEVFYCQFQGRDDFGAIAQLSRALIATEAQSQMVAALRANPAIAALMEARYWPPRHDREALQQCPPGSLGYVYSLSLQQDGLYPDLYSDIAIVDDVSYVEARLGQTHDLWHVVTGFGTSVADEIGLQAFHLAQFPYPFAALLIANALASETLLEPGQLPGLLAAIEGGWQLGKRCQPLFAQRWEEAWDKPLTQWQAELGIFHVS
jgi:ubiquinone biosynthesis protein COQ4